MREATRKKWKIGTSLAMCVVSLLAAVTATLSWFAINNRTYGKGMEVQIYDENTVLGVEYYKLTKSGDRYVPTVLGEGDSPSLGVYSSLTGEWEYAVLLKLYLAESPHGQVRLSAETVTAYFLGDQNYPLLPPRVDNAALPDNNGKSYTNALSSIISFGVLTNEEIGALTGDGLTALPRGDRLSTFVDLTGTDRKPTSTLPLRQTADTTDTVTTHTGETWNGQACEAVYVLMTYDSLLVNTVFSANIGSETMNTEIPLPFVCDFQLRIETVEE